MRVAVCLLNFVLNDKLVINNRNSKTLIQDVQLTYLFNRYFKTVNNKYVLYSYNIYTL